MRPPGITYCQGKVCYDKRGAVTAKNKRYKEDHVTLRIYPCPNGDHWHLTHLVNKKRVYKKIPKQR